MQSTKIYIAQQDADDTTSSSRQSYQLQGPVNHFIVIFGVLTRYAFSIIIACYSLEHMLTLTVAR